MGGRTQLRERSCRRLSVEEIELTTGEVRFAESNCGGECSWGLFLHGSLSIVVVQLYFHMRFRVR